MAKLQRTAPDPLYQQLKATLVSDIHDGKYATHQRLPSERELSLQFKVSRMTVRQALLELAREGSIYTRTGKGTFVAEPKIDQQLRALTGFSQDVRGRGSRPTSRVLKAKVIPSPIEVAIALRLTPSADVIMLSRLRISDSKPLALETAYLPYALFPKLLNHNFAQESLYEVLESEYHLRLTTADQTIESTLAEPNEIELLKLTPPAAVLRIQRLTLTSDGNPVEYVLSTYRGDRYKFHSILQAK